MCIDVHTHKAPHRMPAVNSTTEGQETLPLYLGKPGRYQSSRSVNGVYSHGKLVWSRGKNPVKKRATCRAHPTQRLTRRNKNETCVPRGGRALHGARLVLELPMTSYLISSSYAVGGAAADP